MSMHMCTSHTEQRDSTRICWNLLQVRASGDLHPVKAGSQNSGLLKATYAACCHLARISLPKWELPGVTLSGPPPGVPAADPARWRPCGAWASGTDVEWLRAFWKRVRTPPPPPPQSESDTPPFQNTIIEAKQGGEEVVRFISRQ